MSEAEDRALDTYIRASAGQLSLPLDPAWQASIRSNLRTTLQFANAVAEFELPDDAEPAPVFEASGR